MKAAKPGQSPVTPTLTGNSQAQPFTRNSAFLNTSRYVMPSVRPPKPQVPVIMVPGCRGWGSLPRGQGRWAH